MMHFFSQPILFLYNKIISLLILLLLAICTIIDSWSWEREGSSCALGEVTEKIIGGLSVGGEEEVTGHQLQVIFLSYSCMVMNPGTISQTSIAARLSLISHVNLSSSLLVNQGHDIMTPCPLGQVQATKIFLHLEVEGRNKIFNLISFLHPGPILHVRD